jgi:hypothetical protein
MRVIRQGAIHNSRITECRKCQAVFEFDASETRIVGDPVYGDTRVVDCPMCGDACKPKPKPKPAAEGVKPDEAVVRDAKHYRWLLDFLGDTHILKELWYSGFVGEDADSAIAAAIVKDAAMAKEPR